MQPLNLCVGSPLNATAKSTPQEPTIQRKGELASGRRAKRLYLRQDILDKYGRTTGCPGCVGIEQWIAEQELNEKCWIKVMQLNLRQVEIRKKL